MTSIADVEASQEFYNVPHSGRFDNIKDTESIELLRGSSTMLLLLKVVET